MQIIHVYKITYMHIKQRPGYILDTYIRSTERLNVRNHKHHSARPVWSPEDIDEVMVTLFPLPPPLSLVWGLEGIEVGSMLFH